MQGETNVTQATVLEAYIAHQTPGRMRLRVPAAKGRPDLLREIVAAASSATGIQKIECNPLTGSLVIHHSAAPRSIETVGSLLSGPKLRVVVEPPRPAGKHASTKRKKTNPSAAAQAINSFFDSLDDQVRDASNNEVDLKVLLPLAAGTFGFLAFRQKVPTPLWLTLMIFAFNSFLSLHNVANGVETQDLYIISDEGVSE